MRQHVKKIVPIATNVGIGATILISLVFTMTAYSGKISPLDDAKAALIGMCFPLGLFATIACAIIWLVLRNWRIALIPCAAMVICSHSIFTYSPMNITSEAIEPTDKTFTLLTYNVMNFTDLDGKKHEENRTLKYILDANADVVCVQEGSIDVPITRYKVLGELITKMQSKYRYIYDRPNDLIILSKYPFTTIADSITTNAPEKSIAYTLNIQGRELTLINVHLESIGLTESDKTLYRSLTNLERMNSMNDVRNVKHTLLSKLAHAFKERAVQAQDLRKFIDNQGRNVILCGDFNDMPDSYAYRTIKGEDMRDAYADCAFGPTITYHVNRFFFKIDQVMYRGDFHAVRIERARVESSDHYPLLTTFKWNIP